MIVLIPEVSGCWKGGVSELRGYSSLFAEHALLSPAPQPPGIPWENQPWDLFATVVVVCALNEYGMELSQLALPHPDSSWPLWS